MKPGVERENTCPIFDKYFTLTFNDPQLIQGMFHVKLWLWNTRRPCAPASFLILFLLPRPDGPGYSFTLPCSFFLPVKHR